MLNCLIGKLKIYATIHWLELLVQMISGISAFDSIWECLIKRFTGGGIDDMLLWVSWGFHIDEL